MSMKSRRFKRRRAISIRMGDESETGSVVHDNSFCQSGRTRECHMSSPAKQLAEQKGHAEASWFIRSYDLNVWFLFPFFVSAID